jgi:hypothetical protein
MKRKNPIGVEVFICFAGEKSRFWYVYIAAKQCLGLCLRQYPASKDLLLLLFYAFGFV